MPLEKGLVAITLEGTFLCLDNVALSVHQFTIYKIPTAVLCILYFGTTHKCSFKTPPSALLIAEFVAFTSPFQEIKGGTWPCRAVLFDNSRGSV